MHMYIYIILYIHIYIYYIIYYIYYMHIYLYSRKKDTFIVLLSEVTNNTVCQPLSLHGSQSRLVYIYFFFNPRLFHFFFLFFFFLSLSLYFLLSFLWMNRIEWNCFQSNLPLCRYLYSINNYFLLLFSIL